MSHLILVRHGQSEWNLEKKFAHDQELQFKVSARRNKYIGECASKILGYDEGKKKNIYNL